MPGETFCLIALQVHHPVPFFLSPCRRELESLLGADHVADVPCGRIDVDPYPRDLADELVAAWGVVFRDGLADLAADFHGLVPSREEQGVRAQVRTEFGYYGGGLDNGATVTLYVRWLEGR